MRGPLLLRCTALTCYTPMILGWGQRDEAARVHYAPRRRYGRTAARCLGAAAGDAGGRVSQPPIARDDRGPAARIPPGPQRYRLCRGGECRDRVPLRRESSRPPAGTGGRPGSPSGRRDRYNRRPSFGVRRQGGTTTIPIVFSINEDPVRLGLVDSLARPGGNLTGVNFFSAELVAKRLELLHELVPGAARVAVLVNPAVATTTATTLRDVEAAAPALGLQLKILNAST